MRAAGISKTRRTKPCVARLLPKVASGEILGGTALSNPMKFSPVLSPCNSRHRLRLGVRVRGQLPWVSNLGPGHVFGAIFQSQSAPHREIMALVPCDAEGFTSCSVPISSL